MATIAHFSTLVPQAQPAHRRRRQRLPSLVRHPLPTTRTVSAEHTGPQDLALGDPSVFTNIVVPASPPQPHQAVLTAYRPHLATPAASTGRMAHVGMVWLASTSTSSSDRSKNSPRSPSLERSHASSVARLLQIARRSWTCLLNARTSTLSQCSKADLTFEVEPLRFTPS